MSKRCREVRLQGNQTQCNTGVSVCFEAEPGDFTDGIKDDARAYARGPALRFA